MPSRHGRSPAPQSIGRSRTPREFAGGATTRVRDPAPHGGSSVSASRGSEWAGQHPPGIAGSRVQVVDSVRAGVLRDGREHAKEGNRPKNGTQGGLDRAAQR